MTALRRDAALNRERLLAAAETVFSEQGLDAGVEEVARVAGVGVGTLYRRFPTKDALIAELVRELLTEVHVLAVSCLEVPGGRGLERFLLATAAAQATHRGCLARLWEDEHTAQLKTHVRTAMSALLVQAQDSGQIRSDVTPADLDLVFWSVRGVIEVAGAHEPAWRRHLALLLAGLRPSTHALTEPALTDRQLREIKRGQSRRTPGVAGEHAVRTATPGAR